MSPGKTQTQDFVDGSSTEPVVSHARKLAQQFTGGELEDLIEAVVNAAMLKFWEPMGYDLNKLEDKIALRETWAWASRGRKRQEKASGIILNVIVTAVTGGVLIAVANHFQLGKP